MREQDLSTARWQKSSYSGGEGNNCVETAGLAGMQAVRDSKNPDGPTVIFSADAWTAFLATLKA
ncbi:DUF397 domain-containing protein [Streptomyces olivaceiscleroticus]|uniref:DUF397 domain-containing protein n=1 Tax=Streptomyces olivaceiscleroticus TaxID=68245 RepID=A0ABP3JKR0_9ACTN